MLQRIGGMSPLAPKVVAFGAISAYTYIIFIDFYDPLKYLNNRVKGDHRFIKW
jgi:hypothetical protein